MSVTEAVEVEIPGQEEVEEKAEAQEEKATRTRDVVYLDEPEDVDPEAFRRHYNTRGQTSPFDKRIEMLDNPVNHNKWKWVAVYGSRDTANQTASRLRRQYPGVAFQRGDHPSGKHGVAAFYDPEAVQNASQEAAEVAE